MTGARRGARLGILVTVVAILGVFAVSPAYALDITDIPGVPSLCDNSDSPSPQQAGGGFQSLLSPPKPGPSLYSQHGMAGVFWATKDLSCTDVQRPAANGLSNAVLGLSKFVNGLNIDLARLATNREAFAPMDLRLKEITGKVGEVTAPWVPVMIALLGCWLVYMALARGRVSAAFGGLLLSALVLGGISFLISDPGKVTGVGDAVTLDVSARVASALPGQDPEANVYDALVLAPVGAGLGFDISTPQGRSIVERTVAAQAIPFSGGDVDADKEAWQNVADTVETQYPAQWDAWRGQDTDNRMSAAFASLAASLLGLSTLGVVNAAVLVFAAGLRLFTILGPLFLTLAVFPGVRDVAVRWASTLLELIVKGAAVSLLSPILVWTFGIFLSFTALPWAARMIVMAAVAITPILYRSRLRVILRAATGAGREGVGHLAHRTRYYGRMASRGHGNALRGRDVALGAVGGAVGATLGAAAAQGRHAAGAGRAHGESRPRPTGTHGP